jgi:hypothetical protein
MDNSSDADIAFIMSVNKFFYKHFIAQWSDSDSDEDFNLMLAVKIILQEDNEAQLHHCKDSKPDRAKSLDHSLEAENMQLYDDYFNPKAALYQTYFRCRIRMSRKLFGTIIEGVCYHDPFF